MVFTYRPHVLPIIRFWKQAALTRGFDAQRIDDFIQVLLKEPETPMQSIKEEGKAILKEQGMSGGEQNKDEEAATMVANMDKLEKEEPGSTKKEKDAKEDKKAPLSAEEQKEFPKLPGMKLFEAQAGTAVEYDKAAAQKYKAEIEEKMKTLKDEAARLVGKKRKSQRAHARRAVAALKADQRYVDACKIVKGLKPKSHHFLTKEAVIPEAPIETKGPEEETEVASKKGSKKKTKKEGAGSSPAETKEPETPKQPIKEEGMSGGEQNKDEVVKMVARMNELKEKQEPGSTKKEKDARKDKKAPLSAEQQKESQKLQGPTTAEYDKAAAEKYKAEIEKRTEALVREAALLLGHHNKKECAAIGKQVAELKAEQRYVDACKIVKGLEPKFGHFVTKAAVIPEAPIETTGPQEETKVASKKGSKKKKTKKDKKAPLSAEEQKEFQKLQGEIEVYKAKLRTEFGYSNKDIKADPDLQEMESRIAAFQKRS